MMRTKRRQGLAFCMILAMLLSGTPMVAGASELGREDLSRGDADSVILTEETRADDSEAQNTFEAEAERKILDEAAKWEEEARQRMLEEAMEREAQMAAEKEKAEAARTGGSGAEEVGDADVRAASISWRVDGDTVVISGEGYVWQMEDGLKDAMAAAKKVRFEECKILGSMYEFFWKLENLESIELGGLDTSQVTDMGSMFCGCSGLTSLDVSGFDTSQVTGMSDMFSGCSGLTSLDVSGFDTSQVTGMSQMFLFCSGLTSLDVSRFDTSQVTYMSSMFFGCSGLTSLDVSRFDTSQVTDMSQMFSACISLMSLDVSGFDTSRVTDMSSMFSGCSDLTSLDVSRFNTSQVTNMNWMFSDCSGLTGLDVSGFDTSQVMRMDGMFSNCTSLKDLDLSNFVVSQVENKILMSMIHGCSDLRTIKVFKVVPIEAVCSLPSTYVDENGNRTDQITAAFAGKLLTKAEIIGWVDGDTVVISGEGYTWEMEDGLYDVMASVKKVRFEKCRVVGSMQSFFQNLDNLESIELGGLDTSQVTDMGYMFYGCSGLTSLDMGGLDTSQVENMGGMFSGCASLKDLDLSNFDAGRVEYIGQMLDGCNNLRTIKAFRIAPIEAVCDLPGIYVDENGRRTNQITAAFSGTLLAKAEPISWRVDKDAVVISGEGYVEDMEEGLRDAMAAAKKVRFEKCLVLGSMQSFFGRLENLEIIDLQELDTSYVTDMGYMFYDCSGLTSLDVSGFATSQVTDMGFMFSGCSGLTSLDVSGFDTSQVTNMTMMFIRCSGLTSLDLSGFDASKVIDEHENFAHGMREMLSGCTNLVTIKAFKVPPTQAKCDLPGTYADESGTQTTQITAAFAGKTLTRVGQDAPNPGPSGQEQQVRSFVSRMYTVALGREAEEAGQNDWTNRLLSHEIDGAGIANGFIMSDEFKNKNVTDENYVDILYHTFFDRDADEGGRATWLEALANGNSRAFVLAGFVNSVEFDNLCSRYGIVRGNVETNEAPIGSGVRQFVNRCYIKVLGREGEKAGVDDWTSRIARGEQTPESVAKLFFFSEEYANKNTGNEEFVETLYQTFMDRASDPAGKSDWVGRLSNGTSREEVLEGFSRSEEFAGIMASFGL